MKKFICFIIGHKWNQQALYHNEAYCERCRFWQPCCDSEPFTLRSWLWWKRYYINRWWLGLKNKWREWRRPKDDDDTPF